MTTETPRGDALEVRDAITGDFPPHDEPIPVVVKGTPPAIASTTFGTQQTTLPLGGAPKMVASASPLRHKLTLRNAGAKSAFLAASEQVSVSTGFELVAGASIELTVRCDVWAVALDTDTTRIDALATFQ